MLIILFASVLNRLTTHAHNSPKDIQSCNGYPKCPSAGPVQHAADLPHLSVAQNASCKSFSVPHPTVGELLHNSYQLTHLHARHGPCIRNDHLISYKCNFNFILYIRSTAWPYIGTSVSCACKTRCTTSVVAQS